MVKRQNEFGCTLIIDTEEENPNIVTELMSIQFSEILIKGDNKVRPQTREIIGDKFNQYNLWMLKIERQRLFEGYLNSSIELMLDLLDEKREKVLGVLKKFPKNHLVCYGYFYELNPYFIFDKTLIGRLNYYNIDIEFDIYCLNED